MGQLCSLLLLSSSWEWLLHAQSFKQPMLPLLRKYNQINCIIYQDIIKFQDQIFEEWFDSWPLYYELSFTWYWIQVKRFGDEAIKNYGLLRTMHRVMFPFLHTPWQFHYQLIIATSAVKYPSIYWLFPIIMRQLPLSQCCPKVEQKGRLTLFFCSAWKKKKELSLQ